MFPVLIVQCAQAGLLYVNGAFCGELSEPQMLPVRPDGRVYVEYRALEGPAFPLAVALDFRDGRLSPTLPLSAYAVQWPDQVIELELRPSLLPKAAALREPSATPVEGTELFHQRSGQEEAVYFREAPLFGVPAGTHDLRAQPAQGGLLLMGEHPGGASAWLLDAPKEPEPPALADEIHAQQIALESDGALRALSYANDTVGHAHLTVYRPQDGRLKRQSRQHAWMPGAPRWPQTELDTLRAYLDALRADAAEEAAAYLTPSASAALDAAPLPAFHAVVALPRPLLAPPDNHPLAVGLLEAQTANFGVVCALCASVVQSEHAQGRYLLDSVKLVE